MNWRDTESWCRLCGDVDGSVQVDCKLEENISQLLQIKLIGMFICSGCSNYLKSIKEYRSKAETLQAMFQELLNVEKTPQAINKIRSSYLLTEIEANEYEEVEEENYLDSGQDPEKTQYKGCELEQNFIEELSKTAIEPANKDQDIFEESESLKGSFYLKPASTISRRSIQKTENEKLYDFKCHVCQLEFMKFTHLATHCRDDHQTSPQVVCWGCGATLSTWKRLLQHKSKHTTKKDESYNCDECKISYKTKMAYDKHNLARHGPEAIRFICSQCGKEFKERQILKNHEKIHLPDELKLKHPCTECGKKFVNSHCLRIHVARVHEKKFFFSCEFCGKGFITLSDLKWHMDKHIEERNYECDICHLKFKSTNSLRIHKRRHTSDKKTICPVCGKEFFSSAALSNHKLVHSDVKRYKCFCGTEFKRLETYKCHLNSSHTGERPFVCLFCPRTFVNSANCRKHKLKDHAKEVELHEAIHGKKGVSLAVKKTN